MMEEERVRQTMVDMATGDDLGHKLAFFPRTKTIRPISKYRDPDDPMEITPEDATLGGNPQ